MCCPKCGKTNILVIDISQPPNLFECSDCRSRFHSLGFDATNIVASATMGMREITAANPAVAGTIYKDAGNNTEI